MIWNEGRGRPGNGAREGEGRGEFDLGSRREGEERRTSDFGIFGVFAGFFVETGKKVGVIFKGWGGRFRSGSGGRF